MKASTKKKTDDPSAEAAEEDKAPKRTVVRAKTHMAWDALLKTASEKAWRRLRVVLKIRDRLLAGKPADLNAAQAMLRAKGMSEFVAEAQNIVDPIERAQAAAAIARDAGLCEFVRREGKPGIWIPSNNVKAGLKENWSVLGLRVEIRGSRGALAEGMFVSGAEDSDWIRVGDAPDGTHEAVAHTTGASGPVSSIKRHEYVVSPRIEFVVMIATAKSVNEKISDDELAKVLIHFGEHGMGACRSQGFGKFDVVSVEEIGDGAQG